MPGPAGAVTGVSSAGTTCTTISHPPGESSGPWSHSTRIADHDQIPHKRGNFVWHFCNWKLNMKKLLINCFVLLKPY